MIFQRVLRLGRSPQRDVDDELAFHFESRIEALARQGMAPADARRQAEAEFGDVQRVRDTLLSSTRRRAARRSRLELLRDLWSDVRYAGRSMRTSPGFATTVVLTLALGIGATSTMFGIVDRLLLRGPDGITDANGLRRVYAHVRTKASGEFTTSVLSYSAYTAIRDRSQSVARTAAYGMTEGRVGRGIDAMIVQLGYATGDFFTTLGAHPAVGRFFDTGDDRPPEGAHVVVVSFGYWQGMLDASPTAIGSTLTLDDRPFTVIGVAPRGFTGAELRQADLWVPVSSGHHPTPDWWTTWQAQWLKIVVRPKAELSSTQVDEELTSIFRAAYADNQSEWRAADLSARSILLTGNGTERPEAPIARWLSAVALIVLIIAWANVANLLIVRSMRRYQEIAVRLMLGISRARLARLLLLESLTLSFLGAAAGMGVAYAGGEMMRRIFLPNIAWTTAPVSVRVLGVGIALALLTGALIGIAPVAQAWSADLAGALRGVGVGAGVRRTRARRALLAVQAAFSVMLLVGAGLFVRSLANVRRLDLGVRPERVLVAEMSWPRPGVASPTAAGAEKARQATVWRDVRERLAHYPGVDRAALAIGTPFGYGFGVSLRVPGRDTLPTAPGGGPYLSAVGVDYFETVGTPLVRGRAFTTADGAGSERVAIVNQTMASLVWPSENPIGKCIIVAGNPCSTVVGVVRDARREGIREPASMQYYIPFGQESGFGGTTLLVRPRGDAPGFVNQLRRAIAAAAPDANRIDVYLMQDRVDPQIRPWRLGATMFGLFGALALLVTAIGLYSTIAYSTAQRTREFGVRLAVGSGSARLVGQVLYEAVRTALAGALLGIVAALVAGRWVAPLLFDESPTDPAVFVGVSLVLVAVALVASFVPAWRAAHTDPVAALRSS